MTRGVRAGVCLLFASATALCSRASAGGLIAPDCESWGAAGTAPVVSATGWSGLDYFTGGGHYMPRTHCMVTEQGATDWPWVVALLALTGGVVVWYIRIFAFWMQCYFQEDRRDRNPKLFDLAAIFLLCAVCGYATSIVMFFWPGYRLLAFFLLALNLFSFRFCMSLGRFRQVFTAGRLERQLREEVESRAGRLEAMLSERSDELRVSEQRFRTIVQNLPGVAFRVAMDEQFTNLFVSDGIEEMTGYPATDFMGDGARTCDSITAPEDVDRVNQAVRAAIDARSSYAVEYRVIHRNGETRWVSERGQVVCDDGSGEPLYIDGLQFDITARKRLEDELRRDSLLDRLTGLPNRSLFLHRLEARCAKPHEVGVLFLDFDRFKMINDTLGHDAGDELLRQIAARLRKAVGPDEALEGGSRGPTVARLGGDEFVVLLGEDAAGEAEACADRVVEACRAPFRVGHQEVATSVSVGVATAFGPTRDAEGLLRNADIAMYEAKVAGRGRVVRFDQAMRARRRERLLLEQELRASMHRRELSLVYQPIVSLETGRCVGVEALTRWNNARRGPVPPSEFIPLAEESDLIIAIGEWAFDAAAARFAAMRRSLGAAAPSRLSVNMSRRQLACPGSAEAVFRLLETYALEPSSLQIEVTETQVVDGMPEQVNALRALRERGVVIAMDDFGTGLSSLAALHTLPIDVVKIDRTFVNNLGRGTQFMALARSIIDLAGNLGLQTVAEGVETGEHLAALQALGCPLGQGYLFARPLSAEQCEEFCAHDGAWSTKAA